MLKFCVFCSLVGAFVEGFFMKLLTVFVGSRTKTIRTVSALCVCAAPELENVLAEAFEVENRSGLFRFHELLRAGLNCIKL